MNITRRDFLKWTAASLVLGPAICPRLWAEKLDNSHLGTFFRQIWEMTSLKRRVAPASSMEGKILGRSVLNTISAGEQMVVRNELMSYRDSEPAQNPRTLLSFGHITDAHIVDEESPGRTVAAESYLEQIGVGSAFRPQEDLAAWVTDSMIRTLNQISSASKFDFLLNTGDCVDNSQINELEWFLSILEGGVVNPDSGANEDPRPGPLNDANDPFYAPGFDKKIPYYNAIGNHDVLIQGNIPLDLLDLYNSIVRKYLEIMVIENPVGDYSKAKISPWLEPPDTTKLQPGTIAADSKRKPMRGKDFIQKHLQYQTTRPVKGFPASLSDSEYGYYAAYPKSGLPLKMIVLDTTFRLGSALGIVDKTQFEQFLVPELEKAKANKELVMIVSHHPSADIKTLGSIKEEMTRKFGRDEKLTAMITELMNEIRSEDSYISRADFEETLKSYPNVFVHVAGHKHSHKVETIGDSSRGYWSVQTSSLMTYPQQGRLFEIVYEGNNVGAIQTCVLDHDSPEGSLPDRSRQLSYQDSQRTDTKKSAVGSQGLAQDRNTILRFNIPPEIAEKL